MTKANIAVSLKWYAGILLEIEKPRGILIKDQNIAVYSPQVTLNVEINDWVSIWAKGYLEIWVKKVSLNGNVPALDVSKQAFNDLINAD